MAGAKEGTSAADHSAAVIAFWGTARGGAKTASLTASGGGYSAFAPSVLRVTTKEAWGTRAHLGADRPAGAGKTCFRFYPFRYATRAGEGR
jgi:hypothetical protein